MLRLLPLALVLGILPSLAAQEVESPSAPTTEQVIAALEAAVSGEMVHFEGDILRKKPGADGPLGQAMMMIGPGGPMGQGAAKPFEGSFLALRAGKDVVLRSSKALPGFEALLRKGDRIVRTTTRGEPLAVKGPLGDLGDLLDAKRLVRCAKNAEWKVERKNDGSAKAVAKLAGTLIRPEEKDKGEFDEFGAAGGGMPFGQAKKVQHVEAELRLDAKGKIAGMRFAVVRFDPQKAMMRRVMEQALENGGEVEFDPSMLEGGSKKPADMERDVYVLEPGKADAKLTKLHEELSRLMK